MNKTCTTCKYEPDWEELVECEEFETILEAGRCRYPLPLTMTPHIGKTVETIRLKDMNGRYLVNSWSGVLCYAWEAKDES